MVMFAVCIIQLCRITPHIHTWWQAMEGKGHFFSHSHSVTNHGGRRDISPPWFVVKCECVFSSENSKLKDLVFNFNPPPVILFLGCGGSRLLRWMGWYDSSMQKGVQSQRVQSGRQCKCIRGIFVKVISGLQCWNNISPIAAGANISFPVVKAVHAWGNWGMLMRPEADSRKSERKVYKQIKLLLIYHQIKYSICNSCIWLYLLNFISSLIVLILLQRQGPPRLVHQELVSLFYDSVDKGVQLGRPGILTLVTQSVEGARTVSLNTGQPRLIPGQVKVVQQPPHLLGGGLCQFLERNLD